MRERDRIDDVVVPQRSFGRGFVVASQILRALLVVATLLHLRSSLPYAHLHEVDIHFGFGPDMKTEASVYEHTLSFREVVARRPAERWQLTAPFVIASLLAWEAFAHHRARRAVPRRAPRGGLARLLLLLGWLALVAVATFEIEVFDTWTAAAGQRLCGTLSAVAVVGAAIELIMSLRLRRKLQRALPRAVVVGS